jgi:hypothetical protein
MSKLLTKALIIKMERCATLANKHSDLVREVDAELIEKGVDIATMRCINDLYTDVVEYGGVLDTKVMEEAFQRTRK